MAATLSSLRRVASYSTRTVFCSSSKSIFLCHRPHARTSMRVTRSLRVAYRNEKQRQAVSCRYVLASRQRVSPKILKVCARRQQRQLRVATRTTEVNNLNSSLRRGIQRSHPTPRGPVCRIFWSACHIPHRGITYVNE